MDFPNIFTKEVADKVIGRINKLTPETNPQWGTMGVAEMLAHCCVAYELVYDNKHPKPNAFTKFMVKLFAKKIVTGNAPYKRNSRTAPMFIMKGDKDFNKEKKRLIDYITKTQELGEAHFDGKESHSFGTLTKNEWNNLFYKHIDHHLSQFGV
ncbi:DUF1569 domain-containing protein [Aureibaculum sp. 2210JD6-5]|uniref:DUF1569 domain-containing protein n=1 Tax=Aureibaculum sp. 2210JD6-5 TaxID=3103957 RepID=UPI002AAEBE18|nr:DUF1569 domain-containing protein [Aureibaculum sp. 2210JD6-5]MDY7395265.1 DUF1569 domain-containing protein [Aureibaculum sp. 2210JD6-5]